MDLQKAREKFAEINLKHGFYTQEELKFTDLGVFECTAAEQDFDMWWECLIYYAQPLIDQKEKALLEQFEINNKLVEQVEKLKAQAVPEWISVEDRLPPCDFEFCETGERVSNAVLIHSAATYEFNMGMGHVNEDGVWNVYSGEHDFMNVLMVTHWMPLPDATQEPAND